MALTILLKHNPSSSSPLILHLIFVFSYLLAYFHLLFSLFFTTLLVMFLLCNFLYFSYVFICLKFFISFLSLAFILSSPLPSSVFLLVPFFLSTIQGHRDVWINPIMSRPVQDIHLFVGVY